MGFDFDFYEKIIDPGAGWGGNPFYNKGKEMDLENRREDSTSPAIVYPDFEYDKFSYPEFDEDFGFTERKAAPLDLTGITKQLRQRQAITGVEPSAEFVSGIAEPALQSKAKESIMFEELNMKREREERSQAFREYGFGREQEFQEFTTGRDIAFREFEIGEERTRFEEEIRLKERELEIAEKEAEKSDGKIVCTELCRQGLLAENILKLDCEHRFKHIDDEAYHGYLVLMSPVVGLMQKSKLFTHLIKPLITAFAHESASRMDKNIKGNLLGKILLKTGKPICRTVSRLVASKKLMEVI